MQKIQKIYELFAEEAFRNACECRIEGGRTISNVTSIYLQRWNSQHPLFTYITRNDDGTAKEELITLHFKEPIEISPSEPPSFNYLYWLEPIEGDNKNVTFKYVECGTVTPLSHLDIAFDDSTKINLKKANPDELKKDLKNSYVFDGGKYQFLFIKAYQNGTQNWHLYGYRKGKEKDIARYIEVALEENVQKENVRVVKYERYSNVIFPIRFDDIDVLVYESVDFADIGIAGEAHDALINRENSGDALMSLWKEYSRMELELAREEQNRLGRIEYQFCNKPKGGLTHLSLNVNAEQADMLSSLAASNAQFELLSEDSILNTSIVTLVKFNHNTKEATVEDELYRLPRTGILRFSMLGNEIVDKRRTRALKFLFKARTVVLQNLLFAIENEADKMMKDEHKHIPAMSRKTETFLREEFGIEKLTKNQEEAVELALNNRQDITIIQGPPGTGKTTVIAAICHRLLELAGKREKKGEVKTILASAFQNDTVEHLASKIYTHGLPTVKVGRKTLGLRAEELYINKLNQYLQDEINTLGGDSNDTISRRLANIATVYDKENNLQEVFGMIAEVLPEDTPIENIDFDHLREIKSAVKKFDRKANCDEELIQRIPIEEDSYNFENGFNTIMEIVSSDFDLDGELVDLLHEAPEMNPSPEFLALLLTIKNKLLDKNHEQKQQVKQDLHNEIMSWIENAVEYAVKYEETSYENEEEFICSVLTGLKHELDGNKAYIRHSLQEYGETVAATNQLAGSKEMKDFTHINNVILEEAARSNPLDLLIPMVKAEDRIIMVGDQNQLPHLLETEVAELSLATIEDIDEKKEKRRLYEKSLFGIIYENVQKGRHQRCITLEEQFRMHPTIGNFISHVYYQDKLKSGREDLAASKLHGLSLSWAKNKTIVFCNVDSNFPESRSHNSKCRRAEATRIMSLLDELKEDPAFKNLSVGIITFYSQQVRVLFEEAENHGYAIKTSDGYGVHPDYRTMEGEKEKLRIGSVDSFQGKEFDIVILSTVRSNSHAREEENEKKVFGFLTLKNRLNVAFSRAQKLVVVVGDLKMFDDDYAKEHVNGLYEVCTNITKKEVYGNSI